jgi:hypothetical protein
MASDDKDFYQSYSAIPVKEDSKMSSFQTTTTTTTTNLQTMNKSNRKAAIYITIGCVLFFLGFMMDDECWNDVAASKKQQRIFANSFKKTTEREDKAEVEVEPTLKPGGGRDWNLNVEEGTISAKHDDSFVLGAYPFSPLVLTHKDQANQIKFPLDRLKALKTLKDGKRVFLPGLGRQFPNERVKVWTDWYYAEVGVSKDLSLSVEYLDDNFITFKDVPGGHDMVLDITLGIQVEGNTVNFVSAREGSHSWWSKWFKPKTFQYGGGRDWIINLDDGTIAAKHTPYLVLGYGPTHLMLTEKTSSAAIRFNNLEALANGETATLSFIDSDKAVGKLQDAEQYSGPWRYIEGGIVPASDAVPVKYIKNNYIATAVKGVPQEKSLVLDVTYWQMYSGNNVNFVGGWTWEEEPNEDEDIVNDNTDID